jgi:hypothetical protein
MLKLLEKSPAGFAKRLAIKHHDSISWLIPDRYLVFSAPGGKIPCIEAEPTNLSWIRRSIDLNGYKNIQLCNLALTTMASRSFISAPERLPHADEWCS